MSTWEHRRLELYYLLASSKMSSSSLASFSLATSAMGPKMTTGLRNPAVHEQEHVWGLPKARNIKDLQTQKLG